MAKSMSRVRSLYGPDGRTGGRLGVSRTYFFDSIVYRPGGDKFIPGTKVPRLRLAKIGERAVAAFDDEVDALIEALRAERDKSLRAERAAKREAIAADGAR